MPLRERVAEAAGRQFSPRLPACASSFMLVVTHRKINTTLYYSTEQRKRTGSNGRHLHCVLDSRSHLQHRASASIVCCLIRRQQQWLLAASAIASGCYVSIRAKQRFVFLYLLVNKGRQNGSYIDIRRRFTAQDRACSVGKSQTNGRLSVSLLLRQTSTDARCAAGLYIGQGKYPASDGWCGHGSARIDLPTNQLKSVFR